MGSPALSAMLSWVLLSDNPTRPQAPLSMGLATQTPNNSQAFECVDPGYARAQIDFPPATVVDGTAECVNTARLAWGPFSNQQVIKGFQIWDAGGTLWWVGSLQADVIVVAGQTTGMLVSSLPVRLE